MTALVTVHLLGQATRPQSQAKDKLWVAEEQHSVRCDAFATALLLRSAISSSSEPWKASLTRTSFCYEFSGGRVLQSVQVGGDFCVPHRDLDRLAGRDRRGRASGRRGGAGGGRRGALVALAPAPATGGQPQYENRARQEEEHRARCRMAAVRWCNPPLPGIAPSVRSGASCRLFGRPASRRSRLDRNYSTRLLYSSRRWLASFAASLTAATGSLSSSTVSSIARTTISRISA